MIAATGKKRVFHNFWEAPHRPLFSAAICCALLSVAWWPLGVHLGLPGPRFEPVVLWHIHELVFGFAAAAIGGYLLTALPAWTGIPPVRGLTLKLLLSFWISARIAMGLATYIPTPILILLNVGYLLLLTTIIGKQLLIKGVFNKFWVLLFPAGLLVGEILFLRAAMDGSTWVSITLAHALLTGLVLLMATVGMRAIPAFTNNWHAQKGNENRARPGSAREEILVQALLTLAIVLGFIGQQDLAYVALTGASLALFWVMRGWNSISALSNPLLAAQHLAFLWLPLGLLTVGASGLTTEAYPMADAWHAITIGGMSGLIMAISGRAAAHTENGGMQANSGFTIGFSLAWFATWCRLAAPIFPDTPLVTLASALWCLGWIAFAFGFLPALTGPVLRPVLSGRRYESAEPATPPK